MGGWKLAGGIGWSSPAQWVHPPGYVGANLINFFLAGQNGGIAHNTHIWWQIPFDASSTPTKRLGRNRGLAGFANRYSGKTSFTTSERWPTLMRNK
jgi:hypothetical protein